MPAANPVQSALDLITIPAAGYAAYWLSVKRLSDAKRGAEALAQEIDFASEPYTRLLLTALQSGTDETTLRLMAANKAQALLRDFRRKLKLIRQGACAIALAENPGRTLITLSGGFGMPVLDEARTMEQAQGLLESMRTGDLDKAVFPDVSHMTRQEELILKLLFFALWARRQGKSGLTDLLPGISFPFLSDALRLCIDGLDEGFIRRRLEAQARELIIEARHKMRLGLEMALAVRSKRPYEETLALARSYLLDL